MKRSGFALRKAEPNARASVPVFKKKTCDTCKQKFAPTRPMQPVCANLECAIAYADKTLAKGRARLEVAEKRADKAKRESLKTRSNYMKEAQVEFNRFIRARDGDLPCISCGRQHEGQWHAGHYRSTGARPELRFDEQNVHKQCQPCNCHLHGNLVAYRSELTLRIGAEAVARLEGPQRPAHLSIDDLKAIKTKYRALARQLEKETT